MLDTLTDNASLVSTNTCFADNRETTNIEIIRKQTNLPLIIDAGIGTAVGYQYDNSYDTSTPYSSTSSVSGLTTSDEVTTTPWVYLVRANVTEL